MAEALLTTEENRTTHRAGVISVYDSSVHVWGVLVEVGVKVREHDNG